MLRELSFQGCWRLTVTQKDSAARQRFIVHNSLARDGDRPGEVGSGLDVCGNGVEPWTLSIEHEDGSGHWQPSELRSAPAVPEGARMVRVIESEDRPGSGDEDFNDLVLEAEKVGMLEVTCRPWAVRPDTLQVMPDGLFEASLGRYFVGVPLRNIWTEPLTGCSLGIPDEGQALLAPSGIKVIDDWTEEEQEIFGQKVRDGQVLLPDLRPWQATTVYFQLDCTQAVPGKADLLLKVVQDAMADPDHPNRKLHHPIFVTRSTWDPATGELRAECDRGTLSLRLQEMLVEPSSLLAAVDAARRRREREGPAQEAARQALRGFLDGAPMDFCRLRQLLDTLCRDRQRDEPAGLLLIPTRFTYKVIPRPPYAGQLGPLPFDDPWWKAVLMVLAILLQRAVQTSSAVDLAYSSDAAVIGTVFDACLGPDEDGFTRVDAALCRLNGNRPQPLSRPPVTILDAQSGEELTVPYRKLDGLIELSGRTLSTARVVELSQDHLEHPSDLDALENARVVKSGARTGLTHAVLAGLESYKRDDGIVFKDQVAFAKDPVWQQPVSKQGDSGSLWIHGKTGSIVALHHTGSGEEGGTSNGTPIEEVMKTMHIRFDQVTP